MADIALIKNNSGGSNDLAIRAGDYLWFGGDSELIPARVSKIEVESPPASPLAVHHAGTLCEVVIEVLNAEPWWKGACATLAITDQEIELAEAWDQLNAFRWPMRLSVLKPKGWDASLEQAEDLREFWLCYKEDIERAKKILEQRVGGLDRMLQILSPKRNIEIQAMRRKPGPDHVALGSTELLDKPEVFLHGD